MKQLQELQPVVEACNQLMSEIKSEFVGLAIQNKIGPDIKWHYAFGNLNDKYKRITVRYGKGIAGKVISSGSPVMIQDFPNDILGKAIDYPIMLAEKLVSSYGMPLFFNGVPKGVLVVGKRIEYALTESEQESVRKVACSLEEMLKEYIHF
ncbi:GAF domain-containing protein [Neobacillus sp. PS3-40]|uniref:GAF domain-containing protein n=1 Tax=Neobacillus sp. PS3-40 TaxID=3070679 RepID=UPI0027DF2C49|nr:GAF domain-containing protein [Neobacillus sp. PS3-40]WML42926.1 GAF domain-containing protein [Neobacillus sp. PS3-40]